MVNDRSTAEKPSPEGPEVPKDQFTKMLMTSELAAAFVAQTSNSPTAASAAGLFAWVIQVLLTLRQR